MMAAQSLEEACSAGPLPFPKQATQIIDRIAEAVIDAAKLIHPYIREHSEFEEIGSRMLAIWRDGVNAFAMSASHD